MIDDELSKISDIRIRLSRSVLVLQKTAFVQVPRCVWSRKTVIAFFMPLRCFVFKSSGRSKDLKEGFERSRGVEGESFLYLSPWKTTCFGRVIHPVRFNTIMGRREQSEKGKKPGLFAPIVRRRLGITNLGSWTRDGTDLGLGAVRYTCEILIYIYICISR